MEELSAPLETQGQADDDFADFVMFQNIFQQGEVGALILAQQCGQTLGRDSERIGNRKADAPGTEVEGEDTAMRYRGSIFHCGHSEIIVCIRRAREEEQEWPKIRSG